MFTMDHLLVKRFKKLTQFLEVHSTVSVVWLMINIIITIG